MPLMENKSAGAIFGTFICRFHISTALSVLNVPLQMSHISAPWSKKAESGVFNLS